MYYALLAIIIATLPLTTHADTTGSLQDLLSGISEFMSSAIIPAILGIAFLAVVWNSVRFFVIGADNEESQQNAKTLAFYSVAAFVFILAFWGIVSMVTSSIGLPSDSVPCEDMRSDYFSKLAPCSSIRPHSSASAAATAPTGSVGAAGGPIPTGPTGSVGAAGGPAPTGATSFDIHGNPLPPTSGVGTPLTATQQAGLTALTATLSANKAIAATYTTTSMPNDFGANSPALAATLFADIATGPVIPSPFNNTDRAVALYRLEKLGVISRSAVDSFISQVNQYMGPDATPLTYSGIATLAITPVATPAIVTSNRNATMADLTTELNDKNINIPVGTPINVPATINSLYNTSIPVSTRVTTFKTFLDDGTITDGTGELYNRFIDDINAEQVLIGIYTTTS